MVFEFKQHDLHFVHSSTLALLSIRRSKWIFHVSLVIASPSRSSYLPHQREWGYCLRPPLHPLNRVLTLGDKETRRLFVDFSRKKISYFLAILIASWRLCTSWQLSRACRAHPRDEYMFQFNISYIALYEEWYLITPIHICLSSHLQRVLTSIISPLM